MYADTPGVPVDAVTVEVPFTESHNANTRETVKG
jgi:aminomethyltransferase